MSKILFDITSGLQQGSGIGAYSRGLATQLYQESPHRKWDTCFFAFHNQPPSFPFPVTTHPASPRLLRKLWHYLETPSFEYFSGKADLFHFPDFIIPTPVSGKKVVTVHDLAFRRVPETCERKNQLYLTHELPKTLCLADLIVVPSAFTRSELLHFYPIPEWASKIRVVGQGVEPPKSSSNSQTPLYEGKPFFLCVGTLEPRKNIPFLVKAFSRLREKYPEVSLVIVGKKGWGEVAITHNPSEGIHWTSYLPQETLVAHYQQAIGFLFPSLYEGFGRPLLESMGYGLPTLTTDASWARELCGEAVLYAALHQEEDWVYGMERLLTETNLRETCQEKGKLRHADFSWDKVTAPLWEAYDELLKV